MALIHLEGWEAIGKEFDYTGTLPNQDETLEYLRSTYHGKFAVSTSRFHVRRSWDGRGQALGGSINFSGDLWMAKYWDTPLAASTTITIGMRIKIPGTYRNNTELIRLMGTNSGSLTSEANLYMLNTQAIRIRRSSSTTVATSANNVFNLNEWHYLEWQTVLDSSTGGSYELRIDGVTVLSGTGVATSANSTPTNTGILLFNQNGTDGSIENQMLFDDWYVCDGTGAVNNDFLGPINVYRQPLQAAGTNTDAGNFGGTDGVADLNSYPVLDDTKGITLTSTSGQKQSYTTIPFHGSTVVGVSVYSRIQTESSGLPIEVKHRVDSGASSDATKSFSVIDSENWTGFLSTYGLDPNTSGAWSQATISAAEFGWEIA